MKKILLSLALFISPLIFYTARSQSFELVKDINPATSYSDWYALSSVTLKNLLVYANTAQVYSTDGTTEGIQLTNLVYSEDNDVYGLTAGSKYVFFRALHEGRYRLFRTDGTVAGTIALHTAVSSTHEDDILDINGTVYFADRGINGKAELWKTDGTIAGTTLVKAIDTPAGSSSPTIRRFHDFNGKLVFLVQSGNSSELTSKLWISDGSTAGTVAGNVTYSGFSPVTLGSSMYYEENDALKRTDGNTITTIRQGLQSVGDFVTVGSRIFFTADDGITGIELWTSDGTAEGTTLVKDIFQGNSNGYYEPGNLVPYKGVLYFSASVDGARVELWKTDGTAAGTVQVSNMSSNPGNYTIIGMGVVSNQLAFELYTQPDPKTYGFGRLWKSDGTTAGTVQVSDLSVSNTIFAANLVYFQAITDGNFQPLYVSDLTAAGTRLVSRRVEIGSDPKRFTNADGTLYFHAYQGNNKGELWKTDGTTAGTIRIKDMLPGSSYDFRIGATVNKTLYFTTNWNVLWKSDGTPAGTVKIKDFSEDGYSQIIDFEVLGNTVFFVTESETRHAIWKTDGTAAGTNEVKTFNDQESYDIRPVAFKDAIYFDAYDGINSHELWKSDGTAAGTVIVTNDLLGGRGTIASLVVHGDLLYLLSGDYDDYMLWKSDGTAAGTTQVISIPGDGSYSIYSGGLFTRAGLLWFSLMDGLGNEKLWRSNGTNAGTFPVGTFDESNYGVPFLYTLGSTEDKLFFVPYDKAENGYNAKADQLWVSDGTVAGTRQLTFIDAPLTDFDQRYQIQYAAVTDKVLYFVQKDPATGTELWRSDGTEAGTYLAVDNHPEPRTGTVFTGMSNLNGTLIMGADGELYKYKPAATVTAAVNINCGGPAFTASANRTFSGDQFFSGTTHLSNAASGDILNTADDQLYKEQRFGNSFSYAIPVKNGQLEVVLHFAEIYWGVPSRSGTTGTNKRKFNVDLEGVRKLTDYDIFAEAGGAMRARTERFSATVADGILNIDFLSGSADKPIIAAIEVLPGGQSVLEPVADAYVRNTPNQETNYGKEAVLEVKTGSLPSYQRKTYLRFALNGIDQVGSAKLRIYGSNVQSSASTALSVYGVEDDNWLETGIIWQNAPESTEVPLSSVDVSSTEKYYELDVTEYVRSQISGNKAVSLLLTNPANQNTRLTFNSRENEANRPQLVIQTTAQPAARTGSEKDIVITRIRQDVSAIYPNPAAKRFTVQLSHSHQGKIEMQLVSLSGFRIWLRPVQEAMPASKLEIDLSSLHLLPGMYLMKVQSAVLTETIKVLLTE